MTAVVVGKVPTPWGIIGVEGNLWAHAGGYDDGGDANVDDVVMMTTMAVMVVMMMVTTMMTMMMTMTMMIIIMTMMMMILLFSSKFDLCFLFLALFGPGKLFFMLFRAGFSSAASAEDELFWRVEKRRLWSEEVYIFHMCGKWLLLSA